MPESFYPASLEVFEAQTYGVDPANEVQDATGSNDLWPCVKSWNRRGEVGQPETLTLELFQGCEWHVKRLLKGGMRLHLIYGDDDPGPATEIPYRVMAGDLGTGSASAFTVQAERIDGELSGMLFRYVLAPGLEASYLWPFSRRTVAETLAILFDTDYGINGFHVLGTVASDFDDLEIAIYANGSSIFQMIQAASEAVVKDHGLTLEYEVVYSRSGGTFTYNFYTEQGWSDAERTAGVPDPDSRPIEASRGKSHLRLEGEVTTGDASDATLSTDNRLFTRLSESMEDYFSRLVPFGGEDEASLISMGAIVWESALIFLDNPSAGYATVRFQDDLVYMEDVYAPNPAVEHYLYGVRSGGLFEIYGSNTPDELVIFGNPLSEVALTPPGENPKWRILGAAGASKNGVGSPVTYVYHPAAEAEAPKVERVAWLRDVSPYPNLFEDLIGGDGSMSTYSGGVASGMSALGSAVLSETTDEQRVTEGTRAQTVEADTGAGIQTDAFDFTPTALDPYVSAHARLTVESGRCVMYFEDAGGIRYPDPDTEKAYEAASELTMELGIGGLLPDLAAGAYSVSLTLKIVATEDNTLFHLDTLAITQSSGVWPYSPRMGPKGLYFAAAEMLKRDGGVQTPEFETRFLDISYFDSTNYARVHPGSWCRLRDMWDAASEAYGLDLEARAMVVESGGPGPEGHGTPYRRAQFARARRGLESVMVLEHVAAAWGPKRFAATPARRGPVPKFQQVPERIARQSQGAGAPSAMFLRRGWVEVVGGQSGYYQYVEIPDFEDNRIVLGEAMLSVNVNHAWIDTYVHIWFIDEERVRGGWLRFYCEDANFDFPTTSIGWSIWALWPQPAPRLPENATLAEVGWSETDIVGLWHFNERVGQVVFDRNILGYNLLMGVTGIDNTYSGANTLPDWTDEGVEMIQADSTAGKGLNMVTTERRDGTVISSFDTDYPFYNGTYTVTVFAVCTVDTLNANGYMVTQGDRSVSFNHIYWGLGWGSGKIRAFFDDSGGSAHDLTGINTYANGDWKLVELRWNGSTVEVWVDEVLEINAATGFTPHQADDMNLGRYCYITDEAQCFTGTVAYLAVFKTVLSDAERSRIRGLIRQAMAERNTRLGTTITV